MSAQSGKENGNSDLEGLYEPSDPELDASIKSFRKAELELDEILRDPYIDEARKEVVAMMVSYDEMKKRDSFGESSTFIRTSLSGDKEKKSGLKNSKNLAGKNNASDLSAEWVREWHRKKQLQGISPADQERKSFISSSLAEGKNEIEEKPAAKILPIVNQDESEKKTGRLRILRFTSIAAAAVLGTFIVFKALLPSGDPQKLYNNYYETFQAVTSTVRSGNTSVSTAYLSAINNYKRGDYREAEAGFMMASKENPSDLSSEFYLGLSQLETGNIDLAILNLTAASETGRFVKESQWYLGLAYLRKGDAEKASECFTALASEDGYYREASEKILRRLKK
ncbi:MAG TPA: hypothetical protein VK207_09215 [Bacteroidales bacterium]|nr:hypothetical protein [Bacteroidales bacterium]